MCEAIEKIIEYHEPYARHRPDMFIKGIPKIYLYFLQNDVEKFTDYLSDFHRYFLTVRIFTMKFIDLGSLLEACFCYNRAEMCLEIARYHPMFTFYLDRNFMSPCYKEITELLNVELVPVSRYLFYIKMLSYPIEVKMNLDLYQSILCNLRGQWYRQQLSECITYLLKIDNEYQLTVEEKKSYLRILINEEVIKFRFPWFDSDSLINTVLDITGQYSDLLL